MAVACPCSYLHFPPSANAWIDELGQELCRKTNDNYLLKHTLQERDKDIADLHATLRYQSTRAEVLVKSGDAVLGSWEGYGRGAGAFCD